MIGAQSQLTHDMMCAAGGAQALALVQDLKQAVDDVTRGSVASALLMEFPPDVETFQKLRPDDFEKAYGEEKPVPNRVDPLVLAKLKSVVPARNTRNTVRSDSAPAGHRHQLALQGFPSAPVPSPIAPMPLATRFPSAPWGALADAPKPGAPAEVLARGGGSGESLVAPEPEKRGSARNETEERGPARTETTERGSARTETAERGSARPDATSNAHTQASSPADLAKAMRLQIAKGNCDLTSEKGAPDGSKEAQDAIVAKEGHGRVQPGKAAPKNTGGRPASKHPKATPLKTPAAPLKSPPKTAGTSKRAKVKAKSSQKNPPGKAPPLALENGAPGNPTQKRPRPGQPQNEATSPPTKKPACAQVQQGWHDAPAMPSEDVHVTVWRGARIYQVKNIQKSGRDVWRVHITKPKVVDQQRAFASKTAPKTEEARLAAFNAALAIIAAHVPHQAID